MVECVELSTTMPLSGSIESVSGISGHAAPVQIMDAVAAVHAKSNRMVCGVFSDCVGPGLPLIHSFPPLCVNTSLLSFLSPWTKAMVSPRSAELSMNV